MPPKKRSSNLPELNPKKSKVNSSSDSSQELPLSVLAGQIQSSKNEVDDEGTDSSHEISLADLAAKLVDKAAEKSQSSEEMSLADLAARLQGNADQVAVKKVSMHVVSQSSTDSDVPLIDLILSSNLVDRKSAVVNVDQPGCSHDVQVPVDNVVEVLPRVLSQVDICTGEISHEPTHNEDDNSGQVNVIEPIVEENNEVLGLDMTIQPEQDHINRILIDENVNADVINDLVEFDNVGEPELANNDNDAPAVIDNDELDDNEIIIDVEDNNDFIIFDNNDDLFDVPAPRNIRTHGLAFIVENEITEDRVNKNDVGRMRQICVYCGAHLFPEETPSLCCAKGKVELPVLAECHPDVYEMLTDHRSEFRKNIRMYNAALSFASFQASIDQLQPGNYVFRIHGTPYHSIAPVHPPANINRRNAQLYIVDNATATGLRAEAFPDCNVETLGRLDRILRQINPFCEAFRMIHEVERDEQRDAERENRPLTKVTMVMKIPGDHVPDQQLYQIPTSNEVAIIFKGDYPQNLPNLRIYLREGQLRRLSMASPQTDPLVYPLIFQHGEYGFQINVQHTNHSGNVSMREYYAFHMAIRDNFNVIMSSGRLTHQYIVDSWARTEYFRMKFIEDNQARLRAELYTGLMDHLNRVADHEHARVGKMVVLPRNFINSPRCKYENYLDAITIFRKNGLPSYFITFTCNPRWNEVTAELKDFEQPNDRPDILARVFKLKLSELIKDITERQIFGVPTAFIYAIEFQKRGLPHAHIVLGIQQVDDVQTADDIDERVCAELPDEMAEPVLAGMVRKHMIHGPCGEANPRSPCMAEGRCKKKYPKNFQQVSIYNPGGYPVYRRRDNGRFLIVRNSPVDNRHVVPYNPFLLLKYDAHINIEVCSGQKWIKYLFKYCFKGHDCLTVAFNEIVNARVVDYNECKAYLDSRYVSAPEAYWRLAAFAMNHASHSVTKLPVHLPGQQMVIFNEDNLNNLMDNENVAETMLTAFFRLNGNDEQARQYLYNEIPLHYVFNKSTKTWTRRQRNRKVTTRLYEMNLKDRERYCLKLLLSVTRGPRSYDELKVVDGVEHETFQQAAMALHLMDNDDDSLNCLEEATHYRMPAALRRLFVSICVHNDVNAINLWERFAEAMCEDFVRRRQMNVEDAKNAALLHIDYLLRINGTSCELQGLPVPRQVDENLVNDDFDNDDFAGRLNDIRDRDDEIHVRDALNDRQRLCYDTIMEAIEIYNDGDQQTVKAFFIDGVGGSGKSFLYETILNAVRNNNQQSIAVAVSGIAATLLSGGQTAHSAFKIPLKIDEHTTCNISVQSPEGQRIRDAAVILWDEASMISCHMLHAIDKLFRDVMNTDCPFGGKVFVLGGDFRQILPIVPQGSKYQQIEACIKNSPLWCLFKIHKLEINMRAAEREGEFSTWLKNVGDDNVQPIEYVDDINRVVMYRSNVLEIPGQCIYHEENIDDWVFDDFDDDEIYLRAVLCPRNVDVDAINERVLQKLPGAMEIFYSSHHAPEGGENDEPILLPLDYMESYNSGSLPRHQLKLKVNAIVMLLRNIDVKRGLCNGTRMIVKDIGQNVIKCAVAGGPHRGQAALLGRLSLSADESAITFQRKQFPVKLSYSLTINKAQGQSFARIGIYLPIPVFSHGQLYVALSRAKRFEDIKVQIVNTRKQGYIHQIDKYVTKNIVFKEVL